MQTQNLVSINGSTGNISITNGGNVSFGGNASAITASYSQSVQTQSNIQGIQANGSSANSGNVSFANSNNITFGMNGNTVTASFAGGGGGGVALSASNASFSSGTVQLANAGGALTIGTAAQQINFSVPATSSLVGTGAVSISTSNGTISIGAPVFDFGVSGNTAGMGGSVNNGLVLVGGNNITLSQASDSNGATVTVNGTTGGGGAAGSAARWEYPNQVFNTIGTMSAGTLSMQHIYVPFNVTARSGRIAASITANTMTTTGSGTVNISFTMGVYTLTGSTLSLSTSASTNNSFQATASSTAGIANLTGIREISAPLAATLTPGEYWVAAMLSTAGTSVSATLGMMGDNQITGANSIGVIGVSQNVSARDLYMGQGLLATGAMPASVALSQIVNTVNSNVMRAAFYHVLYNTTY